MRKSLIVVMLAVLAIFGGSANAADTVAAGHISATGEATQVSEAGEDENGDPVGEDIWEIAMNASFAGLIEGDAPATADLTCTLTANGIAATNPIPDDNPFWTIACANADETSTLLLELEGGNRPIRRNSPPIETGWNVPEVGGPATINGDYHNHVATCRGLLSLPTIELACVIL